MAIQFLLRTLHVTREIICGIIPVFRRFIQRLAQDPLHLRGNIRPIELRERIGENDVSQQSTAFFAPGRAEGRGIAVFIWRLARQHGEQRCSQRINIGGFVASAVLCKHFRRSPRDGVADAGTPVDRSRDAEIGKHGHAMRVDENIAGLDVAVDDAFAVRRGKGARQIDADGEHLVCVEPVGFQEGLVIASRSVFEHGVAVARGGDAAFVHRKNVGMRGDPAHEVRFGTEPRRRARIERSLADLDGHLSAGGKLLVQIHVRFGT